MRAQREAVAKREKPVISEKRCSTCRAVKAAGDFFRSKLASDGYCNTCKECDAFYKKRHRERLIAHNSASAPVHEANATKRCATCKGTFPVSSFTRYLASYDGLKKVCRECASKSQQKYRQQHFARLMLKSSRRGALARGLAHTITEQDIVIPERCPALGIELRLEGSRDHRPSLDRRDNSKGYVPGNVVVVSMRANRTKSDLTIEELRKLVGFYERALP